MRSVTKARASSRPKRAKAKARQASDSPVLRGLARAGLTARGVIYLLIGVVAILVALGQSSRQADQQGALQLLASKPYGVVVLVLLAIGFVGYAFWMLSQAVFGVAVDGDGAGPRLKSAGIAVVYAGLAYLTLKVILGSHGNQVKRQQDWTATVMRHPGGRWLIGIVGLIVVIAGAVLVVEGFRRTFAKYLDKSAMSPPTARIVELLGVVGTVARGVVFALIGVLLVEAAITHKASKSGGIDKALLTLRNQPLGEVLLLVAALGLVIFGVYGLCEARWRKV
jgi:Domain of Unknown Function (DUF1206)